MLLILDAPFDISVFFPSKLDYIGAQNLFLQLLLRKLFDIVREAGGSVVFPRYHRGQFKNGIKSAPNLAV